jgi:hypothetical protein
VNQKTRVNQMLMSNGLGKLDDPGLIPQLGFLMAVVVKGHEEFREFLNRCAPADRRSFYESMRPYLRFELKPLDVYVAELGAIADAKQLPTVAADGTLQPYRVAEISTQAKGELALAQSLIAEAAATRHLALTCIRCTREEKFHGYDKRAAVEQSRASGWQFDAERETETCPKCAA